MTYNERLAVDIREAHAAGEIEILREPRSGWYVLRSMFGVGPNDTVTHNINVLGMSRVEQDRRFPMLSLVSSFPSGRVDDATFEVVSVLPVGRATATVRGLVAGAFERGGLTAAKGASAFEAPASSAAQGARLGDHLRQWEKYGPQGFKELENGRFRYYGDVAPASTPGEMVGRRLVREWDPATGATRTWHETLDGAGNIRQVRPQTGGAKVHYRFDANGKYVGKW